MSTSNKPVHRHCLLVAHGSRLESSNDEIRKLAARLGDISDQFANVECAFLEIASPSIGEGLQQLIGHGATDIVVVPYFLASGRHVQTDIPQQVTEVKKLFPEIAISLTPHIGAHPEMARLVLAQMLDGTE